MSPRRPRRRARRRSPARPVTLLVAAAIVLALIVGGLTQVSRQSQGYDANSDRSLAAQGTVVADQSNATSSTVRSADRRPAVAESPGLAGGAGQRGAADGRRIVTGRPGRRQQPAGLGGHGSSPTVFAERAQSMTAAACRRRRVPRYAARSHQPGRHPATARRPPARPPCSRRPRRRTASPQPAHCCPAPMRLYRSVRRSLASAAGHGRLPQSVWVTDPQLWQLGSVATQVDLLATSSTLAATHDVFLRTVRLTPPALPAAAGRPGGRVGAQSHVPARRDRGLGQPGLSGRTPRLGAFLAGDRAIGCDEDPGPVDGLALGASVTLPDVVFRVKPSHHLPADGPGDPPCGPDPHGRHRAPARQLQVVPGNLSADPASRSGPRVDPTHSWS